jgi:hypothetical protein
VTLVRRMSWCYSSVQALMVRDYLEEQQGRGHRRCGKAGNPSGNPVLVTGQVRTEPAGRGT